MTTLNQIHAIRRRENVSIRTFARHLGTTIPMARDFERPEADLRLSDLKKVAAAIGVPAGELLCEVDNDEVFKLRALCLRLMRSVNTMLAKSRQQSMTHRVAESMRNQIVEIMPEADTPDEWPEQGRRRTLDELGRVADFIHVDDLESAAREPLLLAEPA